MPIEPTFDYETPYWEQGLVACGVDEVGMGALAGPVVAAAVIFSADMIPPVSGRVTIRDSKTLSKKQRETAAAWIKEQAIAWAVGEATAAEVDTHNVRAASHLAMARAVDQLTTRPDILIIDGTPAQPHSAIVATNIIAGDAVVFSIAAASILAKVHRDTFMEELAIRYPAYGFAGHKGYGSALHMTALREYGATEAHRMSYAPVAAACRVRITHHACRP